MANIYNLKVDGKDYGSVHLTQNQADRFSALKGIEVKWIAEMTLREFYGDEED